MKDFSKITPSERVQAILAADRPLVIAHRGYSMAAPENTLPAFELGLLAQADLVELDYHHSRDGVPMVIHDATLDRTTDARGRWHAKNIPVATRSAAELNELDAGSWRDSRFQDVRIPTLDTALELIQPRAITLIERKEGDAATLVNLLKQKEVAGDVVVWAFDLNFVAECHTLAPGMMLGALGPPETFGGRFLPNAKQKLSPTFLDAAERTGARVIGWNHNVTKEVVHEAQRRGLRVFIYAINDLATALDLLEKGINGIISDNPPVIWKALALHGSAPRSSGS